MRKGPRFKWAAAPVALTLVLVLAGCSQQQLDGFMPGKGATDHATTVENFWVNSWIVLLAVGIVTWGLVLWATVAYRRRKGEKGMPEQLKYHMPIEIFFTVVPLILVAGFFAFTAKDQTTIETQYSEAQADVHIEAYGKQWAWDFNYLPVQGSQYDAGVYFSGIQAQELKDANGQNTGEIDESQLPVLYLPVNAKVSIDLKSRDVAHSFWVVDFHYKKDNIPGKTNQISFVTEREGTYIGKCAELCGEYHSMMLFQVKVVSAAEYNAYIQSLRDAGQTGSHGDDYNRNQNLQGVDAVHPAEAASSESK